MKDTQNIAVILLLCSAVILTGLLIGSYTMTSQSAKADSSQRLGSFITTVGAYSDSTDRRFVVSGHSYMSRPCCWLPDSCDGDLIVYGRVSP